MYGNGMLRLIRIGSVFWAFKLCVLTIPPPSNGPFKLFDTSRTLSRASFRHCESGGSGGHFTSSAPPVWIRSPTIVSTNGPGVGLGAGVGDPPPPPPSLAGALASPDAGPAGTLALALAFASADGAAVGWLDVPAPVIGVPVPPIRASANTAMSPARARPPAIGTHFGRMGPWSNDARSGMTGELPGRTSTLNGWGTFEPVQNVSRTLARIETLPRSPGPTMTRSGWTWKSTRRSGSTAPTTTSTGALPRLSIRTSWRPVLLPRDVAGTISAAASVNGPRVTRPSSTEPPVGSAAARIWTPNGKVPARG